MKVFLHTAKVAFAFLALSSFAFAQDGTIKGRVHNDNENLPNATVSFGNKTAPTNNKGEFSFSATAGTYTLIVTHAGYKKIQRAVIIEAGHTRMLDLVMEPEKQLGEVVVVGSRSAIQRTNLNTPVPVDVFSTKQLLQTGQINLTQMLNFTAPSFNASRELLNEPVTLRGLDPQHVLILLNGTRYHNVAWYYMGTLKGQLGRGSVGNDLNSIPFSAIDKVEILRDGASAQYGSDAIAGVINIRLKETTGKTAIQLHTGQYYAGDGEKFSFGINHGFSIHKKGFLNFSADYRYQEPAYRGGIYQGTVYLPYPSNATHNDSMHIKTKDDSIINAKGFDRKSVLANAGTLKTVRAGALLNGGYTLNNHIALFWTAAINDRKVWRDAAYRFPKNPSQVNLVLYPNGFQAKDKNNNIDISTIAGIKGEIKNHLRWDITSSYGQNVVSASATNTNNPSQSFMGKEAPTSFYTDAEIYRQLTNNINFSKTWIPAPIKLLNIAVGAEWRVEQYRTRAGDSASWYNYDPTGAKQDGGGVSPDNVLNKNRNVLGTYIDIETELNNRFLLDAAGRYEYYSDFGSNVAGKLAARYKVSECFMLRASASNGFRAPSLQQRYAISTSTDIDRATGRPLFNGLFPNDHEVAKALGIPSLTAERTLNVSSGLTAKLNNRNSLTVDAYWIQIKNRIILSGSYDRNNRSIDSILKPYTNLSQITEVSFFSNAVNTRTYGVDLVFNGFYNFAKSNLH
ncbi:MAG: TonB-dependent receptor, partial [Ferruginibacter sp.]